MPHSCAKCSYSQRHRGGAPRVVGWPLSAACGARDAIDGDAPGRPAARQQGDATRSGCSSCGCRAAQALTWLKDTATRWAPAPASTWSNCLDNDLPRQPTPRRCRCTDGRGQSPARRCVAATALSYNSASWAGLAAPTSTRSDTERHRTKNVPREHRCCGACEPHRRRRCPCCPWSTWMSARRRLLFKGVSRSSQRACQLAGAMAAARPACCAWPRSGRAGVQPRAVGDTPCARRPRSRARWYSSATPTR